MTQKLWGGRFEGEPSPLLRRLNDSFAFDRDGRLRNPIVLAQLGARSTFAATELERFVDCSSAWLFERVVVLGQTHVVDVGRVHPSAVRARHRDHARDRLVERHAVDEDPPDAQARSIEAT